jgi:transcriptional regulator with XRE-family HTH domain
MKTETPKVMWSEKTQGLRQQLGSRIVELRRPRGLSQQALADLLDVSRDRLGNWEGGRNAPTPEDLVVLSEFFGVSVDELLTGKKAILSREECAELTGHVTALLGLLKPST